MEFILSPKALAHIKVAIAHGDTYPCFVQKYFHHFIVFPRGCLHEQKNSRGDLKWCVGRVYIFLWTSLHKTIKCRKVQTRKETKEGSIAFWGHSLSNHLPTLWLSYFVVSQVNETNKCKFDGNVIRSGAFEVRPLVAECLASRFVKWIPRISIAPMEKS